MESDTAYQTLAEKKRTTQLRIENLKAALVAGTSHPSLSKAEEDLAKTELEMNLYVKKKRPVLEEKAKEAAIVGEKQQLEVMQRKVESMKNLKMALDDQLKLLENKDKTVKRAQFSFDQLKAEIGHIERLSDRLYAEIESLQPELDSPSRVTVWQPATVARGIEGSRRLKYTAIASVLPFLIGLGLVVGLEYRNRRINEADEVSSALGVQVIGSVPALPKKSLRSTAGYDGNDAPCQRQLAESVDSTRTLLLHGLDASSVLRTIMVTSAVSGEGKTSLAAHLSVSMARAGFKTLLIDADLRRPALHKVLGVPMTPGLSDLLSAEATPDAVIRATSVYGLWVIPAGYWNARLPRVLAGTAWRDLKIQLETEFDYIIVDTSPILPVADALLLARHADGVVMSMLHDVSRLSAAAIEAKDRLSRIGANILGVVINGLSDDYSASPYTYAPATAEPIGSSV